MAESIHWRKSVFLQIGPQVYRDCKTPHPVLTISRVMGKPAEWILALSCAVLCGASPAAFAKPAPKITVKEVSLAEIRPYPYPGFLTEHWIFTEDCKHLAYETKLNGRTAIFLDDRLAGSFEKLIEWELEGDGSDIVAVASCSNKWTVVVHGTNGPLFDWVGPPRHSEFDNGHPLVSSPDDSHLAYIATDQGQRFVVLDGKRQKAYDEIIGWKVVFSGNSQHYAYLARSNGTPIIVVDGREVASSCGWVKGFSKQERLAFWLSPDGQRLAYIRPQGTNFTMVVDGKSSQIWDSIDWDQKPLRDPDLDTGLFSTDSAHFSYAATRSETNYIVLDDCQIADATSLHFSPDGKRWAYVNGSDAVVVDGVPGQKFSGYVRELEFSPDSKNFAYMVGNGLVEQGIYFFVLNGKRSPEFSVILMEYHRAHHIAIGCSGETTTLFIDGNKMGTIRGEIDIEAVAVSDDGRRIAYPIQREERRLNLSKAVANSKKAVKNAVKSGGSISIPEMSDSYGVHFVVVDNKEYGPYHDLEAYDPIQFSPDSKHFAFINVRRTRQRFFQCRWKGGACQRCLDTP